MKPIKFEHIKTESNPDLWTVGLRYKNGDWMPESDHFKRTDAVERADELNKGIAHPDWGGNNDIAWFNTITLPEEEKITDKHFQFLLQAHEERAEHV